MKHFWNIGFTDKILLKKKFYPILFFLFTFAECRTIKLKTIQPNDNYKSDLSIEKYVSVNPKINAGYIGKFIAMRKKPNGESISDELFMNVESERYNTGQYFLYGTWAVVSGYSLTLIPFYRKERLLLFLKSKRSDAEKVYEMEFTECYALLLLNCALFKDFQPAMMSLEKRIDTEIIYQATYDYL